jgi:hypothetical protein
MGRVIIKSKDGRVISLKCKSKERAREIAGKRPDTVLWDYYGDNEVIPRPKKKQKPTPEKMSMEQMERMIEMM